MPFSSIEKRIILALFVVAFALRLFGLSHDLHLDSVYHPDTPKQMRAVQQFLRGDYLVFQGHSDYDGYPYFNSHLIEWIVRGTMAVESGWRTWTGAWEGPVEPPTYVSLYWLTRVWNAFLSALSIPLLVAIGRRFHPAAGWIAASLMVVSPLDISAAHFASNDSAVAFFCLAALWFGLRIAEAGRWRDLAGGAFCVAAAFSSKYHGGMAFLPVLIGHVLYCRTRGGIVSRAALARWVFTGLVGLVAIFLTSPALIVNLDAQVDAVLHFFQYTANFALPAAFKELPAYQRFWIGLQENGPVIADAVGWPVLVSALAAWALVRRDPRVAMLTAVPLLHVVVGMAGKPFLHQAHHTPVTAYLLLAAVVVWLVAWNAKRIARPAVLVAMAWTAGQLSVFTVKELASFHVSDTRRVAESWMLDAVPPGVQWLTGRYTLVPPPNDAAKLEVMAIAQSGDEPHRVPGMVEWARFSHADNRFSKFINRDIHFHTVDSEHLVLPARPPYLLPFPGGRHDRILSLDAPWFGRSTRVRDVRPYQPVRAWAVTTGRLERAWVVLQTGDEPASARVSFGGVADAVYMPPGSTRIIAVDDPHSFRLPLDPHRYYRWRADATWGTVRAILISDAGSMAWWAMEQGRRDTLAEVLPSVPSGSLAADLGHALLSPVGSPERAAMRDRLEQILADPAAWLSAFGMSETWMQRLPYMEAETGFWSYIDGGGSGRTAVAAALPLLPAGPMVMTLAPAERMAAAEVEVHDHFGRLVGRGTVDAEGRFPLPMVEPGEVVTVRVLDRREAPRSTHIAPEPRRMVAAWRDGMAEPFGREAFAATTKAPQAEFAHGIQLQRVAVDLSDARPGGRLAIDTQWWVAPGMSRPDRYSVWLHVVDATGALVAQQDKGLWYHLERTGPDHREPARREVLALPEDLAPGRYEIRTGVWIPAQRKRLRLVSSILPEQHAERYLVIDRFEVPVSP